MTEKQYYPKEIGYDGYTADIHHVKHNGELIADADDMDNAEIFSELLNRLTDTINLQMEENKHLKQQIAELHYSKKMLRTTNKDLELGIRRLRKSFDEFDKMRVEHIQFLQKRMKKYGISIYYNDDEEDIDD